MGLPASRIGALAGGQGGNAAGPGGGTQAVMRNLVIAMLANRQGAGGGASASGGVGGAGGAGGAGPPERRGAVWAASVAC